MSAKRSIDERDIDDLLASLTDRQIAELFGMSEAEVATIRRERRAGQTHASPDPDQDDGSDGSSENSRILSRLG